MKRDPDKKSWSFTALWVLGLISISLGYMICLNVHNISVGGVTGIAVLLNKHFGLSYTISMITMNALLFIYGIKVKGIAYVIRSSTAMVALSLILDMEIPWLAELAPQSRRLAMIIGSAMTGFGYGAICATDSSTGGSDLLAMILVKRIPGLTIGIVMNTIDFGVVVATGILDGGMSSFAFSLSAMLICNTLIDLTCYRFGNAELPTWIAQLLTAVQRFVANIGFAIRNRLPVCRLNHTFAAIVASCILIVSWSMVYTASGGNIPFISVA